MRLLLALRVVLMLLACGSRPASSQPIEGVLMPGEVISAHAKWEQDCKQCHEPFDRKAQTRRCAGCHDHKDIAEDIRKHTGLHGKLDDNTCRRCHTEHKGRAAKIVALDKEKLDHDKTDFALKGAHYKIRRKCESCHKPGPKAKFRDAPTDCNSCHRKADVHKGKLGPKCEQCHNDVNWKETTFDHDETKFRLEFGHDGLKCKDCHNDQLYKDTPKDCVACHKKDDQKYAHKGRFGTKCAECHTVHRWDDITFDHDRDGKYVLRGMHWANTCESCHKEPLFTVKLPSRCYSCHRRDDDEKGHKGSLGEKCEKCHDERGWKDPKFDHDKDSDYPLTGKHRTAKCDTCHKTRITVVEGRPREKLPTQCNACHQPDDQKKGHKGKFGEKCETCHTTKDWKDITFNHDKDTKYRLIGKHVKAKCVDCHTGVLYKEKTPTDCLSCHRKDDNEKGHKSKLSARCDECHNINSWKVEKFNHNRTRYPLVGAHARTDCKKCHETLAYRDTPTECFRCHEKDDTHKRKLGVDCETCHNMRTWKSWDFDHDKTTYRLDGAHVKVKCEACHKTPMQKQKGHLAPARTCMACHAGEDVHQGGYGARCERCHETSSWRSIKRY
jgi:hypothetical protein